MRSRKVLNKKTGRYVSSHGKIGSRIIRSKKRSYKKRSRKIIKSVKKYHNIRRSPSASATLFPISTSKIGNDGNIWTVRRISSGVKRWIRK